MSSPYQGLGEHGPDADPNAPRPGEVPNPAQATPLPPPPPSTDPARRAPTPTPGPWTPGPRDPSLPPIERTSVWSGAKGYEGVNYNMTNLGLGAMDEAARAARDYEMARRQQLEALGLYRDAAMGDAPSEAQALMQQVGDRNAAQQMQMMAGQRGGNLGGQARSAVAGGLAAQNQTQQNLGSMRAQEMAAARAGFAGLGADMVGQAQGGQQMFGDQQMNLLGMQSNYDQSLRDQALRSKMYKTERNLGWASFGGEVVGSALDAIPTPPKPAVP